MSYPTDDGTLNARDWGVIPDGRDCSPGFRDMLAECVRSGYRRIRFPGYGSNVDLSYYRFNSTVNIPAMPPVHNGAPVASLTLEGDHYANTLFAGVGGAVIATVSPLNCIGINFELHVTLNGPVKSGTTYPHRFSGCGINNASLVANVNSAAYLTDCTCAYDGGWVIYSAGASLHHEVYATNCQLISPYIVGSAAAGCVIDNASIVGGSTMGATPVLNDANTTVTTAKVVGVAGMANRFGPAVSAAITAPTAPSAGYVQAEATSAKTAIDAIRAALTAAGITL